uniref:Uncharacterized protein LOC111105099 n=1 Tax=Crassostrea virginica TaxID=6565 RepID=A0A8B8AUV8_CRAVI|nr:uncharacterized protein LOC111105099 [Crassostrea virginica]
MKEGGNTKMKIINVVLDTKGTKLPDFVTVVLWDTMVQNVPIVVHILIMERTALTSVTVRRNSVILSMDVKLPAKQLFIVQTLIIQRGQNNLSIHHRTLKKLYISKKPQILTSTLGSVTVYSGP